MGDIQAQQKTLSSSEEFAKSVFSSPTVDYFQVGPPNDRYAVMLPPQGGKTTIVCLLLHSVPIAGTLQIQFHIFTQPPNSYINIKNLVIFFWGDSPDVLKTQQLTVSYFPDKSDGEVIHALSEREGRVFADDQPRPKYNQPDPDFKGNKWLPVVAQSSAQN